MSVTVARVCTLLVAATLCVQFSAPTLAQQSRKVTAQTQEGARKDAGSPSVLQQSQMEGLLPATVYFKGKTAPTEMRNSAGIRFGSAGNLLAAIVDNSGYASAVQEQYQFYLITEVPVSIAGQRLAPGAYGAGIVADKMVILDIGGHQLLQGDASMDSAMTRPRPLQIVADGPGHFKLYLGKRWVGITAE